MRHKGIVMGVSGRRVRVRLDAEATGCPECALRSCCSPKGLPLPAEVKAVGQPDHEYAMGQTVTIEASGKSMVRAIWLGCVVPVCLLLACVFLFSDAADPTLGAALGLVAVAAWFLALKLAGERLQPRVTWRIVG